MDQPRISTDLSTNLIKIPKKSELIQLHQQDNEELFPLKKLNKNFEHSVGFSQTNYSHSRSRAFSRDKQTLGQAEALQKDAHLSFSSELRKASLIDCADSKFQKYKHLLPSHLSTKFHPKYEQLLKIAHQIDKILERQRLLNFMESFENIKNELRYRLTLEIEFTMLGEINSLMKDSYKMYRDPLGNLVIGLPLKHEGIKMRKFNLRKQLYAFIHKHSEQMLGMKEILLQFPEVSSQIGKVSIFFPTSNKHFQPKDIKLDEKFLKKLETCIEKEQEMAFNIEDEGNTKEYEITWFVDKLEQFYHSHKVGNIYRGNILRKFRKEGMTIKQILKNLQTIQQTSYYLRRKDIPKKAPIYEIKPAQKSTLLKFLTQL